MLIDIFFYIFVKLTLNVAWSTCASIKMLKLIYAQLDQPTPLFFAVPVIGPKLYIGTYIIILIDLQKM